MSQPISVEPEPRQLFDQPFRYAPQHVYGRPDWDLVLKAFVDLGWTFISDPLFFEAFGWSNAEDEIPMRKDDAFNLASLNKIFTAVSILQLVEQGRLSLEDSLSELLPEDVESDEAGTIQVKHLLSHTSGAMSGLSKLSFSPGTSYAYSNYGYVPLGKIIETVSGMRYEDYLKLYVLGPSGMARTGRYELKEPVRALATGYAPEIVDDEFVVAPNPLLHQYPGGPVGGYFATAADLLRFAESLKSGLLLDRAMVDLMRTPKSDLGADRYGYGVVLWRGPGIWGHAGNLPGTGADLEIYGDTDYVAVVLSNRNYLNPPVLGKIRALFYPQSLMVNH